MVIGRGEPRTRTQVGAAIVGVLLAIALCPAIAAAAPAPTRYEQSDARLLYTGTWYTGTSASYSGASYAYTTHAGSVEASFTGTSVTWITSKGPSFGVATVTVDGVSQTVDLSAASITNRTVVWSQALDAGSHRLKIAWTGQVGSGGKNYVGLDALDIVGALDACTPPPAVVRFEQTDARIHYNGTWYTGTSASYSGGTYAYTRKGGSIDANFSGTSIAWITSKGSSFGIASVTVDGSTDLVDISAAAVANKQTVWSKTLAPGAHHIHIAWTGAVGAQSKTSTYTYVGVDSLDVAGTLTP